MKVLLTIWISAVLIQEVIPSTLVRVPRHAKNQTSLVHTEYEAKYEQKGKHGNESFSSVSGKQQFMHDNCSENWNAFAEKCASLIKDLVASLANVVTSKPGDATNLQLHIKNTFRHIDNTHNCTCLNHTGNGLSDLDLSPLFNNITINTVGPAADGISGTGAGNNNNHQNNCGGNGQSCDEENGSHLKPVAVSPASSSNGGDNNQSRKCSDETCAGHDNNVEKGIEGPAIGNSAGVPQERRKPNALVDSENLDMDPSSAGNPNDPSTNNSRRQANYPQVLRQPENLLHNSDDYKPSAVDLNPNSKYPKNGKQTLYPFLVTPLPAKPLKGSVDPTSAGGHSPYANPLSPPADRSSGAVPVINSHNSDPTVVAPITDTQKSKSAIAVPVEPIIKSHNSQPLLSPTEQASNNHNPNPSVIVPGGTNSHIPEPLAVAPITKKEPSNLIPIINSHSNLPESSEPKNEDVKSVNPSPIYEPIPTGPSLNPSSKVVTGKNPANLPPEEDCSQSDNEHLTTAPVAIHQSGGPEKLGAPTSNQMNQGVIQATPVPVIPLQPTSTLQNQPQLPQSVTGNAPIGGQDPVLVVTPIPAKTVAEAPVISPHTAQVPGNLQSAEDPTAKNINNWMPAATNIPSTSGKSAQQGNGRAPVLETAATTPLLVYPIKPLPVLPSGNQAGVVQPNSGSIENQQPALNLLTTPIPVYPVQTEQVTPVNANQQQGNNPTDLTGNNKQQQYPTLSVPVQDSNNGFPLVNKQSGTSEKQDCGEDCGDDCKDDKSPSNGNLGNNNGNSLIPSTGAQPEHGVPPAVLQSVKPVVAPNSESQTGEAPLGHSGLPGSSGVLGSSGVSQPLEPSSEPAQLQIPDFLLPFMSEKADKAEPVTQSADPNCEGKAGEDPLAPGTNPAELTPTHSENGISPVVLPSVKPAPVPNHIPTQTGAGPIVPSGQSGQGNNPGVLTPTHSEQGVTPAVLLPVNPAVVPNGAEQTGAGPQGTSGQPGQGTNPGVLASTHPEQGVTPAILLPVNPTVVPNGAAQTGAGPLGPSGQSGQGANPGVLTPTHSEQGVTPAVLLPVAPIGEPHTGTDPLGLSGQTGQGPNPGLLTPTHSGQGVTPAVLLPVNPTVVPNGAAQTGAGPQGTSGQPGQGTNPGVLASTHPEQGVTPAILLPVNPTVVPNGAAQTGAGPLGPSGQSGQGANPGVLTPTHSEQGVTPAVLLPVAPIGEPHTGTDPLGPSGQSGQGANPGVLTPTHSEQGVTPAVLLPVAPIGEPHTGTDPLGPSGQSGQGANPGVLTPTHSEQGVTPAVLLPVAPIGEPHTGTDPLGLSGQSGQGANPGVLTPTHSEQGVTPAVLLPVAPIGESHTGTDPLGLSGQSGQGPNPGLLTPTHSEQGVTPAVLLPVAPIGESHTGTDPLGPPSHSGQGPNPGVLTPTQSEQGVTPAVSVKPSVVPNGDAQTAPLGHSGQGTQPGQGAIPVLVKPAQSGNEVTPATTEPIKPVAVISNGKELPGNNAGGENPVLIRPTTFQTTSVEPTAPPPFPIISTKPITVPQDSDETLPTKPSTSSKTPAHHDDDDDDEDCCSCESCTEEEITDPKQFKENACKNLEEARKELKIIFDKIKKKLKCGKKAPQTLTTQQIR